MRTISRPVVCSCGCVLFATFAILSYRGWLSFEWSGPRIGEWRSIGLFRGHACFMATIRAPLYVSLDDRIAQAEKGWHAVIESPQGSRHLGIYWHDIPIMENAGRAVVRHLRFDASLWIPIAICAALLAYDLAKRHFLQADGRERCSSCRYDLTGNLSGRCPECGTLIARETTSSSRGTDPS